MILYSIIIAVFNVENYLEECLDSVLGQSYPNWEAILVDDGSSDKRSGKICDEYAKRDSRFKVFHRENEGSLMARRFGFRQSEGDYILFADSDDYMHKDLLKQVNRIIEHSQSDLVIYRFQWVGAATAADSEIVFPEGTILGEDTLSRQRLWNRVLTCNSLNNLWIKVAKRDCIDIEVDYTKFAFLKSGTDLMQSLPILDRAKKIYFTEKIFYYYRHNDSGISAQKTKRVGLKGIEEYFENKKVLMERRLEYLKKNNADSEENLSLHYASCFKSAMEILVSWLANEPDRNKRMRIIKRVLREDSLKKCRNYIRPADLSKYNKFLFRLFNNQDSTKFSMLLGGMVLLRKAIICKGRVKGKLMYHKSRN